MGCVCVCLVMWIGGCRPCGGSVDCESLQIIQITAAAATAAAAATDAAAAAAAAGPPLRRARESIAAHWKKRMQDMRKHGTWMKPLLH